MSFNIGFAEFFYTNSGDRKVNWPYSGTTEYWTVPSGVHWVWVTAVGGGGGGGSSVKFFSTTPGAGGGGSGASCEGYMLRTTPGGTLSIYVGGGGVGGYLPGASGPLQKNIVGGFKGQYLDYVYPVENSNVPSGASYGFGGENTIIGDIVIPGGYGGGDWNNGGGGKGGGGRATNGNTQFTGLSNAGYRASGNSSPGFPCIKRGSGRFFPGSGGAASASNSAFGGTGQGGGNSSHLGGVEGASHPSISGVTGGAGGAASYFGPGGNGGDYDSNAPAVPTGSYGAGGGGGGGNSTTYGGPTILAFSGADGGHGYVSLHYIIATPNMLSLTAAPTTFILTGKDVTFTYP